MLSNICIIAALITGAVAALCLVAVMRGIDDPSAQNVLDKPNDESGATPPISPARCGWPNCLCTWEEIKANGAVCPSRVAPGAAP